MICNRDVLRVDDVNNVNIIPLDFYEDSSSKQKNASILQVGKKLLQYSREGDLQGVSELLAKGAPLSTDWLGTSPLHLSVINNHYETCEILIKAGVGKDGRTKVDRTPLHFAAYEGHAKIARLLLENGASVDSKDMLNMTPLHWAVEKGHAECVRVLLCFGAKPNSVSRFNKTPLSIAMEMNWTEMVQELQKSNVLEATQSIENLETNEKQSPAKFSLDYEEMLNLNNEKPVNEMETDNIEADKDPQNVFESFIPRVEDVENEETLQLLKEHGITMLPTDSTNTTVNSAFQSGRKIILSDAGKLVLKDVNLQNEVKPAEIKKAPIILPARKLKTQKYYTVIGDQIVSMAGQTKPNILQKLPIDSLKKAATGAGFNFVQLPKNASISPIKMANINSKNAKIINNVPIKTVPNLRILKNTFSSLTNPPSNAVKSDFIKLGPILHSGNKIIKIKNGSNLKIVMKKDVNKQISNLPNSQQVNETTEKNATNETESVGQFTSSEDSFQLPEENSQSEIDMLRSELELVKVEKDFYKNKYLETQAELLLYKNKLNCHSTIDDS